MDVETGAEQDSVRLLREWNDTGVPLPDSTVSREFQRQAAETPDAVAVEFGDRTMSYEELAGRVGDLASELAERGVRAGDSVAILMARSADLVVAMLAVATAGAAYVPLDVRYPAARMRAILTGVGADLLVVDATTRDHPVLDGRPVLTADAVATGRPVEPTAFPDATAGPDSVFHVLHTSGSTGEPKGVAITHRNVIALAYDRLWRDGTQRRFLFHSPHAWDACTLEWLVPLLTGGRVVVLLEDVNTVALRRLAAGGRLTTVWLTAGLFAAVADGDPACLDGVREVWTGGDVVSRQAVDRIAAACPDISIFNGYGPVETTVFATRYRIHPGPPTGTGVPIGTPMDNTRIYVLDDDLRPLPPGEVGGLYVGGLGVAQGYVGRPDLTAERFLRDPSGAADERMYATGDLARRDPDGLLHFAGRADSQVKINGFRIEPEEIESVLGRHPAVARAVVMARTFEDGSGRITAYVVPEDAAAPPEGGALRDFLAGELPAYMVPAEVAVLAELPLTPNGKVDRARLGRPDPGPLSAAQRERWWPTVGETPPGQQLCTAARLTGPLDADALGVALGDVVARHEALRTVFPSEVDGPVRRVLETASPALEEIRVEEAELPKAIAEVCRRPIDPVSELPLRLALLTPADREDEHVLVLVLHRIAGDPASLDVLGRDLAAAYGARREGRAPDWPPTHHADATDEIEDAGEQATDMPLGDRSRPASPTHRSGEVGFTFEAGLHAALEGLAEQSGTTLDHVLRAGLAALLTRLGAGTDVAVGGLAPVRTDVIGPYATEQVFRIDTAGDPAFTELVDRVGGARKTTARGQVLLTVATDAPPPLELAGTSARPVPADPGRTPYDLVVSLRARDGVVTFSRDVFSAGAARGLAGAYVRLLAAVAERPASRLSEIGIDGDQDRGTTEIDGDQDRGTTEQVLADLWSELLDVRVDSPDASFWKLGGDSLLGVTLLARLRKNLGVEVKLRELFRHPRLGDLAAVVDAARGPAVERPAPAAAARELPASSFQQRIWLAERLQPEPGLYNVPLSWRVSGRLDPDRLAAAFARVIERHEALRTTVVERDGELRQVIGAPWRPVVARDRCDDEAALADRLRADADAGFDLAAGPLLRAGLLETPAGQVLTVTVHHIVFDAASVELLLAELGEYYGADAGPVEPAPKQYRDLVDRPDPDAVQRRIERLRGAPSTLSTPAPPPVPPQPHGVVPLDLPADLLRRTRRLQEDTGTSWFMVAAAALAGALHAWTGRDDVTFGFPADTRDATEFAGVLGPCLNTLAARSTCPPGTSAADLVEAVRDEILELLEDRDVPFEAILAALAPPRSAGSSPYLDVVLAPLTRPAKLPEIAGRELTALSLVAGTGTVGKFAVCLSVVVGGDRMEGELSYRGDRLSAVAAAELAALYVRTFEALVGAGDLDLGLLAAGSRDVPEPARKAGGPVIDTDTERTVAGIWSRVLKVDSVGRDDNFFDVGGNSMRLVTLHAELCRAFAVELPIQQLFENSTVAAMARFLTEPDQPPPDPAGAPGLGVDERAAARRDSLRRRARGR
ncbi:MAG TPA: amino acid adenylation domain-containing protein [Mycobacteriales bacterium]|nr:amino acid adenylation domain-containing protein [Mycobacteriales bacterium]